MGRTSRLDRQVTAAWRETQLRWLAESFPEKEPRERCNSTMSDERSGYDGVVQEVRAVFDPLAQRLGLGRPDVVRRNTEFSLRYFGEDLSLSVRVELMDFFIVPMVFCGDVEPIDLDDSRGCRKMHVHTALEKLGVCDGGERQQRAQRLGGDYRNCTEMAKVLAELVEYGWGVLRVRAGELLVV